MELTTLPEMDFFPLLLHYLTALTDLNFWPFILIFGLLFCSQSRKPRSNYRRPSSLGLANTPLPDKSEAKRQFTPLASSRSHIVAPLKDHLRPEGAFEKTSEVHSQYRNLSPSRPVIHKLKDHLKVNSEFDLI